jgi:hypothetical protein
VVEGAFIVGVWGNDPKELSQVTPANNKVYPVRNSAPRPGQVATDTELRLLEPGDHYFGDVTSLRNGYALRGRMTQSQPADG